MIDDSTIVLVEDGVQTGLIASATFDTEVEMTPTATGGGEGEEDCGCGKTPQEMRVAKILSLPAIPTLQEARAREDRLNALLG